MQVDEQKENTWKSTGPVTIACQEGTVPLTGCCGSAEGQAIVAFGKEEKIVNKLITNPWQSEVRPSFLSGLGERLWRKVPGRKYRNWYVNC